MPFENVEVLGIALKFLATYIAEKGLDKLVDGKVHSFEDMSVEEQVYCMLTESLVEFCEKLGIEFDENAIIDTFELPHIQANEVNCDEQLKIILERATGSEVSPKELKLWIQIVEYNLVSDKYAKLFRSVQLKCMKGKNEIVVEPDWMQKHMVNNFIEMSFSHVEFDELFRDVNTELSYECWMKTQDLILEVSLNAFQHGKAKQISLHISETEILILDDGIAFDTKKLVTKSGNLRGGSWTITRYMEKYPEVQISYDRVNERNRTSIKFENKVFSVNGLCEIYLSETKVRYCAGIKLRYPNSKARYYYVDFSNTNVIRSFLCMSGAFKFIDELTEFCDIQDTDVFLYLPSNSLVWDDFAEKIYECLKWGTRSDKIHVIRE